MLLMSQSLEHYLINWDIYLTYFKKDRIERTKSQNYTNFSLLQKVFSSISIFRKYFQ